MGRLSKSSKVAQSASGRARLQVRGLMSVASPPWELEENLENILSNHLPHFTQSDLPGVI